jgi:hypothetical protein
MTPPDQPGDKAAAPGQPRFPGEFRLIPRIETYPAVLLFAQTLAGKLAIIGMFGVGLWGTHLSWPLLTRQSELRFDLLLITLITATTTLPQYRRLLLTFGTLVWTYAVWWQKVDHWLLFYPATLILGGALFWSAIRFRDSWFGRRPVASLLAAFALSVLFASYFPRSGALWITAWSFLVVFSSFLWFIGYSLLDRNSKGRDNFALQLGTYRPFWLGFYGSNIPYVKGAAYLRRIEAQNAEQLAISQIKGVKLFAWSVVLALALKAFTRVVHGYCGIPAYDDLFSQSVHRMPFPWYLGWASLIANFLETLLLVCIMGHRIVATCRMAGFQALRNTYRPLESRSIAEFWNRYFYYFKELLVDFFFYPTFMRYFKRWPRLRLLAATFAAACFGNVFFHFFRDMDYIRDMGFWKALAGFHVYIFYTIILATGIGVSQLRKRKVEKSNWLRGWLLPVLSVTGFYCILSIFDYTGRTYPIQEHFRFLAHILNLAS